MSKTRFVLLSSLLGGMTLLTGCASMAGRSCLKTPSGTDTEDHAPLRIPVGLDAPDTRAALKIPELSPEPAPGPQSRCLEDPPPAGFATSTAEPAPAEKEPKPERERRTRPIGPRG